MFRNSRADKKQDSSLKCSTFHRSKILFASSNLDGYRVNIIQLAPFAVASPIFFSALFLSLFALSSICSERTFHAELRRLLMGPQLRARRAARMCRGSFVVFFLHTKPPSDQSKNRQTNVCHLCKHIRHWCFLLVLCTVS